MIGDQVLGVPALPVLCPCCQQRIEWGWVDSEFSEPREEGDGPLRIWLIPRPDQTFFCPSCEARSLS